jgi:hypothetical protein
MVSPTINRVKGKTLEQRRRDKGRMVKANIKQAGKILKANKTGVRDRGQAEQKEGKEDPTEGATYGRVLI